MFKGILLFGYPGSGKGTQGRILGALPGFHHVATGDLLRSVTPQHPMHDQVQSHLRAGNLVPDDLVVDLFYYHITTHKIPDGEILVIDGLPRNAQQVKLLNRIVRVIKILKLSVYDEEVVVQRMKRRAKSEGRTDDNDDSVIPHRLEVYRQETEPCIKAYPGTILTRIQADQTVFGVHFDIITALSKLRDAQFQ